MPKAPQPNETAPAVAPEAVDQAPKDMIKLPSPVVTLKRAPLKPGHRLTKHNSVARDGIEK
jgi:hypothetical protein